MCQQLFEKLENDRFSATINVVSGLNQFVRALSSSDEFQELLTIARSDADRSLLADRFNQVAARETDPDYENPWDVALAAYLLVLEQVDPKQAALCAERASIGSKGWWSRKFAQKILSGDHDSPLERVPGRPPVSTGT